MKKNSTIVLLIFILTVSFLVGSDMPYTNAEINVFAAEEDISVTTVTEKPAKPDISLQSTVSGDGVKVVIGKTKNADGYRIYMKAPGESKYKKIKSLSKSGEAKRSYTKKSLAAGEYSFKVKAYRKIDGQTVWGSYSTVKKITLQTQPGDIAELIHFIDPADTFVVGGKKPGEREDNLYTYKFEYDESLKDAVFRLKCVDSEGKITGEDCGALQQEEYRFGANRMGTGYLRIFAYANDDDAQSGNNPLAVSEILKIRCTNAEGKTGDEPETYADITFKDGYAYFGKAPTQLITDTSLKSKIISTSPDHGVYTYQDERYTYDEQDNRGPFKYVDMKWRVLERTDEYALLMSDSIISGGGYDGYGFRSTSTWKDCCLRYMLERSNSYTGKELTYLSVIEICERVLVPMNIGGVETKVAVPTKDMLTNTKYGFTKSTDACEARIVKPSDYYRINTNNKAGSYGKYWLVNETAGTMITVDGSGKISTGAYNCAVYEIGVVPVIKVDLVHCNVFNK